MQPQNALGDDDVFLSCAVGGNDSIYVINRDQVLPD